MQPRCIYVLFMVISGLLSTTSILLGDASIDGIVGAIPDKLVRVISHLKKINQWSSDEKLRESGIHLATLFKNRFILYGPPGNGKSTLAYKIAQLSGSEFLRLDGPSIVGSYVGQGAGSIKETFERAYALAETLQRCVVIFIDEIDAIATNNTTEFRGEHQAALQQLWLELDHCKHNPRIFVIFATNYFNKLNKTFLDRFGSNMLEIKNPDAAMRKLILEYYWAGYGLPMNENLIKKIVQKSDGLSIRSLEDLVCDLALGLPEVNATVDESEALKLLAQIRKKIDENISDKKESNESELQKWSLRVGIASGVLTITYTLWQAYSHLHPYLKVLLGITNTTQSHNGGLVQTDKTAQIIQNPLLNILNNHSS